MNGGATQLVRVRWLVLSGAVAVAVGFFAFTPAQCATLASATGYGWMFVVAAATVAAGVACLRELPPGTARTALWPGWRGALVIGAVWLGVAAMDRPGYKVLFDEPMLTATAYTMHVDREFAATTRAYPLPTVHTILRSNLDKRPPLYPFLVATLHDITGVRLANAIALNLAATLVVLWLTWLLGRHYGGSPHAGSVAVLLLGSFPTLGISATGAGMEPVNLALIAALWAAGLSYGRRASNARAALLVGLTLLLAYARYESALYTAAAIGLGVAAVRRRDNWRAEAAWLALPLGLVLYAWHHRVVAASPELWQLHAGQTARFSVDYLGKNLADAARFLFVPGWHLPNSALLGWAGVAGAVVLLVAQLQNRAAMPSTERMALGLVGGGVLATFGVLQFYYWGGLQDVLVARLALPLHLLLAICAVAGWRVAAGAGVTPRWGVAAALAAIGIAAQTVPAVVTQRSQHLNELRESVQWERDQLLGLQPAADLILANRSPLVWLAEGVPALSLDRARLRTDPLRWHLQRHTFRRVFVVQRWIPDATGALQVDPLDALPADWQLEPVARGRFGPTETRISQLVAVGAVAARLPPAHD